MDFSKIEVKSPKKAVNNKRKKREDGEEMVRLLKYFSWSVLGNYSQKNGSINIEYRIQKGRRRASDTSYCE